MIISKDQSIHAVVNNAPKIITIDASAPIMSQRLFTGNGAPSATTLQAGNGKYCGATSGFIAAATLVAAGTGYVVGDILFSVAGGGTATQVARITVDAVNAAGNIVDWHVSTIGIYSIYSTNPVTTTNSTGTGSGATFNLAIQPPDAYIDESTPTAPVLWYCQTSGTNATSVWQKVSGGGGGLQQFKIVSDGGDYWNCNTFDGTTTGAAIVKVAKAAKMRAGTGKIANETIRGVTYTYTYAAVAGATADGVNVIEYTRAFTGSDGSSGTEYITPPMLVGDVIVADAFTTLAPATLVGVPWIYREVDWAT